MCPTASTPSNEPRTYRRLSDETARLTLRDSIYNAKPPFTRSVGSASAALVQALGDFRPELKACIEVADPIEPGLQYALRIKLTGHPGVATIVDGIELRRISGVNPDHSPIESRTTAEACFAGVLSMLELPPSSFISELHMIYRYDGCTPKDVIAKSVVQELATRAFPAWRAAHPEHICPSSLADLGEHTKYDAKDIPTDPWGRPYRILCGTALPNGAKDIGVMSMGRDGIASTPDDVESWNTLGIVRGDGGGH